MVVGCRGAVSFAGALHGEELLGLLATRMPAGRLDAINEEVDETVVTYGFRRLAPDSVPALQTALRDLAPDLRTDLYYTRGS